MWYFDERGHFVSKDLSVLKVINHKTKRLLSLHQATASDAANKDSNGNKNNLNLYNNIRLLSHLQYLILRLWSRNSILNCVPCDIKDWTEENVLPQTIIEHWNDMFHTLKNIFSGFFLHKQTPSLMRIICSTATIHIRMAKRKSSKHL